MAPDDPLIPPPDATVVAALARFDAVAARARPYEVLAAWLAARGWTGGDLTGWWAPSGQERWLLADVAMAHSTHELVGRGTGRTLRSTRRKTAALAAAVLRRVREAAGDPKAVRAAAQRERKRRDAATRAGREALRARARSRSPRCSSATPSGRPCATPTRSRWRASSSRTRT